jgi:hypothetical protein
MLLVRRKDGLGDEAFLCLGSGGGKRLCILLIGIHVFLREGICNK